MKARLNQRAAVILVMILMWSVSASARDITDMAGRRVRVPDEIHRVYGVTPPVSYMVYAMDPALLVGSNFPFSRYELEYLDPRMKDLPVVGGWFGQGRVANLENLLAVKPDIILLWRWNESAVNEKIERILKPLNIPAVYVVMKTLHDYPAAFRFIGELLNMKDRAGALAAYGERVLGETARVCASVQHDKKVTVYYAEGADGLSTECDASVHAALIPLSGGENVHHCPDTNSFGMIKISIEQILDYNPDVIISHDDMFLNHYKSDAKWQNIKAVKNGRVYRIPRKPFNWFDRPPSFMQLLGVQWLTRLLHPDLYSIDTASETTGFYRLFLNVELSETKARELMQQ